MSDRMDDVLSSIDEALAKCICGNPIPENGPSLDYCSPACQRSYINGEEVFGTYPYPAVAAPDGRALNEAVNSWVAASADHHPDTQSPDGMHWIGTEASIIAADLVLEYAPPAAEDQRVIRPVTSYHGSFSFTVETTAWDEALDRLRESLTVPADELRESLLQLGRALTEGDGTEAPPLISMGEIDYDAPPSPEAFRARALEARRNRNTGPQRPDNRRWRNT